MPKGFAFALLRAIYLPFVFGHKRFAAKSALSWLVVSMISGSCGCILRRCLFRIVRSLFYLVEFATSSTTKFITPAIVPFVFAPAIQARHLLHIELFAQECSASYRTFMRMSVFIDCKNLATHNTRSLFGRVLVVCKSSSLPSPLRNIALSKRAVNSTSGNFIPNFNCVVLSNRPSAIHWCSSSVASRIHPPIQLRFADLAASSLALLGRLKRPCFSSFIISFTVNSMCFNSVIGDISLFCAVSMI